MTETEGRERRKKRIRQIQFKEHNSKSSSRNSMPSLSIFIFLSFLPLSLSDPRSSQANLCCGTSRAPPNTSFIPIFVKEMEVLSQLVQSHHWGTHSVTNSTPTIYGLAQCFQDLSHTDCLLCYAAGRTKLPRCLPATSARIHLDGCFLRYDNYSFFNESTDPLRDTVNCSSILGSIDDESAKVEFKRKVDRVVNNVSRKAVLNGGFAVEESEGLYAMAECWKTVTGDGCRDCLKKAAYGVRGCSPSREARGLNAGCYLRYSTEKFYNGGETEDNHGSAGKGVTIAIALAVASLFFLCTFGVYIGYARISKLKKEHENLGRISSTINKSNLNFKYETLEKATGYFHPSRKLGQGGAGAVFRGTLPNGSTVAVKRLFFNTRQWVDDFFNEVNLISGIQHKNLVKLLGCSIEGPESLLVYEYVANKSLDNFFFEKNKSEILSWKQRFDIVVGIAEGLAYLHEGSEIRIIHRDIKSSNILLDESFTPKIADFGLARCFGADKTHLSTGIAGTLGYMAPEYLVRGQLTEKADVYSFGVLVLEIVCGRKNSVFIQDSGSVLQTVWKLYKSDRLKESLDPCLRDDDIQEQQVADVIQIGLLCAQASVALRPSMAEVVRMLKDKDVEIPKPNQPPFLNSSVIDPISSTKSSSINSWVSNAPTRIEVSYTSTDPSSVHNSGRS